MYVGYTATDCCICGFLFYEQKKVGQALSAPWIGILLYLQPVSAAHSPPLTESHRTKDYDLLKPLCDTHGHPRKHVPAYKYSSSGILEHGILPTAGRGICATSVSSRTYYSLYLFNSCIAYDDPHLIITRSI